MLLRIVSLALLSLWLTVQTASAECVGIAYRTAKDFRPNDAIWFCYRHNPPECHVYRCTATGWREDEVCTANAIAPQSCQRKTGMSYFMLPRAN